MWIEKKIEDPKTEVFGFFQRIKKMNFERKKEYFIRGPIKVDSLKISFKEPKNLDIF